MPGFEIFIVNEPSVFEPLKIYYTKQEGKWAAIFQITILLETIYTRAYLYPKIFNLSIIGQGHDI